MRSYPSNSPQAAARIVAMAMLADGLLPENELTDLIEQGVHSRLGLGPEEFFAVVGACCEDLLPKRQGAWATTCEVDWRCLTEIMAEIDDPALRLTVLNLCVSVVEADGLVTEGESIVLVAAVEHWGLQRAMLRPVPALESAQHA